MSVWLIIVLCVVFVVLGVIFLNWPGDGDA